MNVYLVWNDGTKSLYAGTIATNLYQSSYGWTVPAALTSGSQYRIRVCTANQWSVDCGESANFAITNALITEPVSRVLDDGSGTSVYGGADGPGSGNNGDPSMPSGARANRPFHFF